MLEAEIMLNHNPYFEQVKIDALHILSPTSSQEEESQTAKILHTSTECNGSVHYHTPTTVFIHQQQIVQHTQYIIVRIFTNNTSVYKQRSRKKSSHHMIQTNISCRHT